jgi:hypothetical protein
MFEIDNADNFHPMFMLYLLSHYFGAGPSWSWSYGSWIYKYHCNRCLSPLMFWVRLPLRARCTTLYDKVCQWLAAGRWFSPGLPISSTNKTDEHDWNSVESGVNTIKQHTILWGSIDANETFAPKFWKKKYLLH